MNGKLKIRTKVESLDSGSILSDEELAWKLHAELNTGSPRRPRRTREKSGLGEDREDAKDEKEEDKKTNDEAFAAEKKTKEEKLANEKKLEGWAYEVSEYTVSSLLKKRSEILAEAPKEEAPATPAPTSPPTGW